MNIVSFSIRHKVTTIMACVMVAIFGVMGFSQLPLSLMPDIELPMVLMYSTYQAGPQEVENLVTVPLESACATVAGMDELQSYSVENMSMVLVTFTDSTDLDSAMTDLRDKVGMAKSSLPDGASDPVMMAMDMDAMPVMVIALRGSDLASLQTVADDTISPALERIEGVASVDVEGGFENEIAVETYTEKLAGYGLSLSYIAQILSAENVAIPAGSVDNGANTLSVRTDGQFSSAEDVANCLIPLPTGGSVRLGEVANVYLKPEDRTTIARVGGEDCVVLSVNKQSDVNTVVTARSVSAAMEDIAQENPTLEWSVLMDQSDYINMSVDSAISNIIMGVLLAALVLFVFLRDWGATMVISVSMPLCIVSVFLLMRVLGITLNMMSLGGVAMGVGMIVDNSIVVLENIFHYRAEGHDNYSACTKGTGEVSLSIVASTLTTVAVFLPLGLTDGIVGMMFYDFCLTICTLIGMSLIVALTIVPLLSYMLLGRGRKDLKANAQVMEAAKKPKRNRLTDWYVKKLDYFIHHRKRAMLATLAMIVIFIGIIAFSGFEMMPSMDQSSVTVTVSLPTGTETEEAQHIAEQVVDIAMDTVPEIKDIYYTTGGGTMSSMTGDNSTSVTLNLVSIGDRHRSAEEIGDGLREDLRDIAGSEITVSSAGMMDMSAMSGQPIQLTLSGDNYDELKAAADDLLKQIADGVPDAMDLKSSAGDQVPEVDVTLRRDVAAQYGLTAATIGTAVRSQLTGSTATILKVNGEEIDVVVRGEADAGKSLDALRSMLITTPTGSAVPLNMVADVEVVMAPQTIIRQNQSRTITVTGDSRTDDAMGIAKSVKTVVDSYQPPEGITVEMAGESSDMMDSFQSLGTALIVALGLVYFVLASQFESFLMPVIVMMILPVSLLGSLSTQFLFGMKISIVSLVSVIMLAGTVVNSAIVLVDYIKIRRLRGEEKDEAILKACPRRVRPVMMTMLTTVLGLLPMAVGMGEGAEMMKPMAIAMITGMLLSTVVTLLFTPVYYSILDSFRQRISDKRAAKRGKYAPEKKEEILSVEDQ
ncbi:efflux RND transporter permease subunit [Oscillibacter sp.]|uniref:efflux RND transporter permease subunit n=1 Tax=Oscillibacter sp. TaxID=1945593 RepID=UPI00289D72D5|nr:efflux RND transporter permease subunit [Oscillibacter sp.]